MTDEVRKLEEPKSYCVIQGSLCPCAIKGLMSIRHNEAT